MEMETYAFKPDLEIQAVQDQTLIYQLRRSSHKIEELMEEITRLRNDNSTHIKIIFSLQEHLKKAELEKVQLEELIITLRGEIDALQQKFILIKSDNDLQVLESALGILKKRYANCQDQNVILRRELAEKDQEYETLKEQNEGLEDENRRLNGEVDNLTKELTLASIAISDLRKLNLELQLSRNEWQLKYRDLLPVLGEYESKMGLISKELRLAQRGEEGWFCQLTDLRDTVEHIQELRSNARIKKIAKMEVF